jgi:beta-1,4-N-acetylglucosaminyltransferase
MAITTILLLLLVFRVLYALPRRTYYLACRCCCYARHRASSKQSTTHNTNTIRLLIVLGSGGHTAEMLTFLSAFHHPRLKSVAFFLAKTDNHSEKKARGWIASRNCQDLDVTFHKITRSREVGQSWCSTVFTTVLGVYETIARYYTIRPDLVLCNGPGTCLPVVYCGFVGKVLGLSSHTKLIFVESFARVKSLSLTGWLVYLFVDRFVVQWKELQDKWPRGTEYIGKIF